MADERPYSCTVSIVTVTDGKVQQEILHKEYAETEDELVWKAMKYGTKVAAAVIEADAELATEGGYTVGKAPKK